MPYHWLDFTPPQPQIAAAPVEDFVTAASTLALAIIRHENGQQPYTDAEIDAGIVLAGVEPPQRSLAQTRTVKGGQVAAGATVLGLTAEAVRQVEPAIPLLQSAMQYAPWVVGVVALAGIAYMIWARIDDRQRGLR